MAEHGAAAAARLRRRRGGGGSTLLNVVRKPVGVVGLVTPWNPAAALWKLAPALAMGNSVVAKPGAHSDDGVDARQPAERAGARCLNVVHGAGGDAGRALCEREVGALSFTGGTETGAAVAAAVAPRFASSRSSWREELTDRLRRLRHRHRRRRRRHASFLNSGQICLCASRILVENTPDGFYEVRTAFAARAAELAVGHPDPPPPTSGPRLRRPEIEVDAPRRSPRAARRRRPLRRPGRRAPPPPPRRSAATATGWRPPCSMAARPIADLAPGGVRSGGDPHPFESDAQSRLPTERSTGWLRCGRTTSAARTASLGRSRRGRFGSAVGSTAVHMPFGGMKASGVAREAATPRSTSLRRQRSASLGARAAADARPPRAAVCQRRSPLLDASGRRRRAGARRAIHASAAAIGLGAAAAAAAGADGAAPSGNRCRPPPPSPPPPPPTTTTATWRRRRSRSARTLTHVARASCSSSLGSARATQRRTPCPAGRSRMRTARGSTMTRRRRPDRASPTCARCSRRMSTR